DDMSPACKPWPTSPLLSICPSPSSCAAFKRQHSQASACAEYHSALSSVSSFSYLGTRSRPATFWASLLMGYAFGVLILPIWQYACPVSILPLVHAHRRS